MLWTAGRPRRRQFAALDPLPLDVFAAGVGDELPPSFDDDEEEDELSFDGDDEPLDEDDSGTEADVRLSVR